MRLNQKKIIDQYVGSFLFLLIKPLVIFLGILLKRDHELKVSGEILIIKLLGGGSLVVAYPALLGIRKKFPNQKISLLTTQEVKGFAETLGVFDQIHVLRTNSLPLFFIDILKALWKCFRVDTTLDLEAHSQITTVFSILTCARNRLGFYKENSFWRRGIFTHLLFFNPFSGSFHFYDLMIKMVGAQPAEFSEASREFIKNFNLQNQSLIVQETKPKNAVITVGFACSDNGKERMLSAKQWAQHVAEQLIRGAEIAEIKLLGGPNDQDSGNHIVNVMQSQFPQIKIVNLSGRNSLAQSIYEIARSREFWGIDSSLIHFARLLMIDSTSFWGPTDPATRLRPILGFKENIHYQKIACSPCIHFADMPPCRGNNQCIARIFDSKILESTSW